jgi:hypothetical protein
MRICSRKTGRVACLLPVEVVTLTCSIVLESLLLLWQRLRSKRSVRALQE